MSLVIRTAIVEDEPLARRRLERLVGACADLQLVGSYGSPVEARSALPGIDLVFLDVEMPVEDGFALLAGLPEGRRPYVIFTTAHERHALRAFRHEAVDFLLKPYDDGDFARALARARRRLDADARGAEKAGSPASVPERATGPSATPVAGVRASDGAAEQFLAPEAIDWVRVEGRAVLVATGGRVLRARGRLADYERRLAAHGFLRVHRACLVNLARVASVQSRSHGDRILVLKDGQRVELSRHFAPRFDALTL